MYDSGGCALVARNVNSAGCNLDTTLRYVVKKISTSKYLKIQRCAVTRAFCLARLILPWQIVFEWEEYIQEEDKCLHTLDIWNICCCLKLRKNNSQKVLPTYVVLINYWFQKPKMYVIICHINVTLGIVWCSCYLLTNILYRKSQSCLSYSSLSNWNELYYFAVHVLHDS